jgi:glycosyltransferase involved in cell wall biosynthesis
MTVSVAICTCDRQEELISCVRSVLNAARAAVNLIVQLVIIDDGALPQVVLARIQSDCSDASVGFLYHQKKQKGLYSSRLEAIARTSSEIVLFVDDDVTLEPSYFLILERAFSERRIGGFSGLDISLKRPTLRMLAYQFLFLHCSARIGRLSITGFNGSVTRWPRQEKSFETEFFLGFNMAFRRAVVQDLPELSEYRGYSVGEDVFISHFASKRGKLLLDPNARLVHHRSPEARENARLISRSVVINQIFLLDYFFHRSVIRRALFIWSAIGLLVKDLYDSLFLYREGRSHEKTRKLEEAKGKVDGIIEAIESFCSPRKKGVKSTCQA